MKNYIITGLAIVCLVLLFTNINIGTSIPNNYQEMSAGQLLDVKIDYDNQI